MPNHTHHHHTHTALAKSQMVDAAVSGVILLRPLSKATPSSLVLITGCKQMSKGVLQALLRGRALDDNKNLLLGQK